MSVAAHGPTRGAYGFRQRIPLLIPSLAALVYPFLLKGFNRAVGSIAAGDPGALPWIEAGLALLLAFAVPALALGAAISLAEIRQPTTAQLQAKRVALLAVAAPTLFTFAGVVLYMLHDPLPEAWLWIAGWVLSVVLLLRADQDAPAPVRVQRVTTALPTVHGISAVAIVAIFLALHIVNHLTGLLGPGAYDATMKTFRHVYRTELMQPLLVALFLLQVGTGLYFVWRYTAEPSDPFRMFQMASGVYLAFYVLGHMNSVFIFARTYLGIDTGWTFATGAPAGLVRDAWNIRLVPHYWLGVFFALSHLAAGARCVMISRGAGKAVADRFMLASIVIAGIVATAILLGMCGLRLRMA